MLGNCLIVRNLRFLKVKALLREQVLFDLNRALRRIREKMDFEAEIESVGWLAPESYDQKIIDIENGTLSLDDAMTLD